MWISGLTPILAHISTAEVVIALSGGEILYFEIDESHTLNEAAVTKIYESLVWPSMFIP